jgi:uncharacterized lipoprotein YddW (UPF0748 family)
MTTSGSTPGEAGHESSVTLVGVWISFIELGGVLTGRSEADFRRNYAAMMDNCASLGINTVFVHLRPFGDALYKSDYFPWSKYVTGTVGREPSFDPLEVMLEETHKRGIAFHGWINPMRIQHAPDIGSVSEKYAVGEWFNCDERRGRFIVQHGNNWFLNPAYPEVIELIGRGAEEITQRYNVDGIHIDDYFYPTTDTSFDTDAFRESSFSDLSRFRFRNINNMVRTLYSSVKQGNPNALFGISPQGSISNNLNKMYADVEAWCRNVGFTDYIIPQIYYGFDNSTEPFIECVRRWQNMLDGSNVKLYFGLALYKIGVEDVWAGDGHMEWIQEREIIRRQIVEVRKMPDYGGIVFFSYNFLFSPTHLTPAHRAEIEAFKPIM